MEQRYVVDRIEDGEHVVLEPAGGSGALVLPLAWLPPGVGEGDLVVATVVEDGGVRFAIDGDATADRLEALRRRREGLRRGPEGDLSL